MPLSRSLILLSTSSKLYKLILLSSGIIIFIKKQVNGKPMWIIFLKTLFCVSVQKEDFDRDGYIKLTGLFTPAELSELSREYDDLFSR